MPSRYTVSVKEFGRGKAEHRRFSSLADLQTYVRARWEGAEYIDGPQAWHNDYCTFTLAGAKLSDLGKRGGPHGTDEYWWWDWHDLSVPAAAAPALSPADTPADAPTGSNEPQGGVL